jgi:glycosyltransferase involved in cell wall biosynthesis
VSVRLAYVCQYFTTRFGGPVTGLMRELAKSVEVVNYSSVEKHKQYYPGGVHADGAELHQGGLTARRYRVSRKLGGLLWPKGLETMLAEDAPDVVQSEEYYQPASHTSFRYAKKAGVPFIFNHRGSQDRRRTLKERLFFAAANPGSRRLVEGSDAIVCLSEAGRRALCAVYPQAEGKVRIIPNSIDPAEYAGADGASFRSGLGIPEDAPLLLCVARLHPQKRIDLLVRAFAQVKKRVPDSVLCVVGPWFPREKGKADELVRQLGVEDAVFAGEVPNAEVKNAYDAADAVALTSEYEPFGYCLLEAMALSKPTVAFGIGAVPEIVDDGATGYHVPFPDTAAFAERASRMLSDPAASRRMGRAGLARVNRLFHLKDNSAKLLRLYGELGK